MLIGQRGKAKVESEESSENSERRRSKFNEKIDVFLLIKSNAEQDYLHIYKNGIMQFNQKLIKFFWKLLIDLADSDNKYFKFQIVRQEKFGILYYSPLVL